LLALFKPAPIHDGDDETDVVRPPPGPRIIMIRYPDDRTPTTAEILASVGPQKKNFWYTYTEFMAFPGGKESLGKFGFPV
jgi:hypothetical protein